MEDLFCQFVDKDVDFTSLVNHGAKVIDVRENTPDPEKIAAPIIACCTSGARSQKFSEELKAKGYEVYNGGPCRSLKSKLGWL